MWIFLSTRNTYANKGLLDKLLRPRPIAGPGFCWAAQLTPVTPHTQSSIGPRHLHPIPQQRGPLRYQERKPKLTLVLAGHRQNPRSRWRGLRGFDKHHPGAHGHPQGCSVCLGGLFQPPGPGAGAGHLEARGSQKQPPVYMPRPDINVYGHQLAGRCGIASMIL